MSTVRRAVTAEVELSVCDLCGAEDPTGASIGGREFDPRSRSGGFSSLALWARHPLDGKAACRECRNARRHVLPDYPVAPAGGLFVRAYKAESCCADRACQKCAGTGLAVLTSYPREDREQCYGLRLPSEPFPIDSGHGFCEGIVPDGSGKRALALNVRDDHMYLPTWRSKRLHRFPFELLEENGARALLVTERYLRDAGQAVFEFEIERAELSRAEVTKRYGTSAAERMSVDEDGAVYPAAELRLRVPTEILR